MRKKLFLFFLLLPVLLQAQEALPESEVWYRSNAAGLAMARIPSRLAAMREEFCLRVAAGLPGEIPERLRSYYDPAFTVETRTLFEKGKEIRRQWIFRDENRTARLNASGANSFFLDEEKKQESNKQKSDNAGNRASVIGAVETASGLTAETTAVTNQAPGEISETTGSAAGDEPAEKQPSGFIEVFNAGQFITEERLYIEDGSESLIRFFYNKNVLLRTESYRRDPPAVNEALPESEPSAENESNISAEPDKVTETALVMETAEAVVENAGGNASVDAEETFSQNTAEALSAKEPPKELIIIEDGLVLQTTDYYRYTRYNSIRAVERVYHAAVPAQGERVRLSFPAIARGVLRAVEFKEPHIPYGFNTLDDMIIPAGTTAAYNTDTRGRALRETRKDEEGNILAEIENTWDGDRLTSVLLKAGDEERLVEFEYDSDGNRIMEKNYRNGVLERTVRSEGNRDMEDLYMNGAVILRAFWEDGRKISEERVPPGRAK